MPATRAKVSEPVTVVPCGGESRRIPFLGNRSLVRMSLADDSRTTLLDLTLSLFAGERVLLLTGQSHADFARFRTSHITPLCNKNYRTTSLCRGIALLRDKVAPGTPLRVVHGDLYLTRRAALNPVVCGENEVIVSVSSSSRVSESVGCLTSGGRVVQFSHGLPNRWMQTCFMGGNAADLFRSECRIPGRSRWMMHEVFNEMLERGTIFSADIMSDGEAFGLDSLSDVNAARRRFAKEKECASSSRAR